MTVSLLTRSLCHVASYWLWIVLVAWCLLPVSVARADVVVIANRTRQDLSFHLVRGPESRRVQVASGRQVATPVRGSCQLLYDASGDLMRYQLDANSAYFFALDEQGWLELHKIDLGGQRQESDDPQTLDARPAPDSTDDAADPADNRLAEIPVKILVDNREPTPRRVWEARLRNRIERISDILERTCRLRLKVVAAETWDSGAKPIAFKLGFVQFQQQVDPRPGRLAIGFTGRYGQESGRVHLGTTQGMLQSHILIRERTATISEPERVEVLLHEVGHYLGAVHSPDPTSVMRPLLDDDKAIHRAFEIGFDPVNALIINLIADEIRRHDADALARLSPATRQRLSEIYGTLAQALPNEKSIRQFRAQIGMTGDTPLFQATQLIVQEVRRAAQTQHLGQHRDASQLSADKLTEYYVRRAGSLAMTLPEDVAASALILGLGIALDDSDTLLRTRFTRDFCTRVESAVERQERRRALGQPTIRGRRDLAQHFFLSAYLTAIVGSTAAESAGLAKELADMQTASGFSYRDLAADIAGIEFAQRLIQGRLSPPQIAGNFTVTNVMPPVDDLPEGLDGSQIGLQLGSRGEGSMDHYLREIRLRIRQLSLPAEAVRADGT